MNYHLLLGALFALLSSTGGGALLHQPGEETRKSETGEANSSFTFDSCGNVLVIRFFEKEMNETQPEAVVFMKTHDEYIFEAEFVLPADLCRALGMNAPVVISKGRYPMKYLDGVYSVYVPVQKDGLK